MPKKLKKLDGLVIGPDTLHERPELATHIAVIAAQWSIVEAALSMLLLRLVNPGPMPGIGRQIKDPIRAMYLSAHGEGPKLGMLRAAADLNLTATLREEFEELIQSVRQRGLERNRVVHAIWSISPHYPKGVVWADTRDFLAHEGSMARLNLGDHFEKFAKMFRDISDAGDNKTAKPAKTPPSKWDHEVPSFLVYEEGDFEEIETRIAGLISEIRAFDKRVEDELHGGKLLKAHFAQHVAPEPSTALNTPPRKKPGGSGHK